MDSQVADQIYQKYLSATVTINSYSIQSTFTGFIKEIINNRAIIITCAHGLLFNEGVNKNSNNLNNTENLDNENKPVSIMYPLNGSFTNVYAKGCKNKTNTIVSLGVLGMDVNADIAILFTYLPSEIDEDNNIFFGFKFSSRNLTLKWGNSLNFKQGKFVYCIGDSYADGVDVAIGLSSNNSFIYAPGNSGYSNLTNQFLSSLNVDQGTSGAAVLSNRGKILGIVAWRKLTGGNYVAGASQFVLQRVYDLIRKLNPIDSINGFYQGFNFNGTTGTGWVGLTAFSFMDSNTAMNLITQFGSQNSEIIQKSQGIYLNEIIPDGTYGISEIPINHALNLDTHQYEALKVNDIILEVNDIPIYSTNSTKINASIYYGESKTVKYKVYRYSEDKYYNFLLTAIPFPKELNYVSVDSTIKLISDVQSLEIQNIFIYTLANNTKQAKVIFLDRNTNPNSYGIILITIYPDDNTQLLKKNQKITNFSNIMNDFVNGDTYGLELNINQTSGPVSIFKTNDSYLLQYINLNLVPVDDNSPSPIRTGYRLIDTISPFKDSNNNFTITYTDLNLNKQFTFILNDYLNNYARIKNLSFKYVLNMKYYPDKSPTSVVRLFLPSDPTLEFLFYFVDLPIEI